MLASGFEQLLDVTVDEDDGEIFVTDYDVGVYRVSVDGTQAKLIIEDVRARGACFAKTSTDSYSADDDDARVSAVDDASTKDSTKDGSYSWSKKSNYSNGSNGSGGSAASVQDDDDGSSSRNKSGHSGSDDGAMSALDDDDGSSAAVWKRQHSGDGGDDGDDTTSALDDDDGSSAAVWKRHHSDDAGDDGDDTTRAQDDDSSSHAAAWKRHHGGDDGDDGDDTSGKRKWSRSDDGDGDRTTDASDEEDDDDDDATADDEPSTWVEYVDPVCNNLYAMYKWTLPTTNATADALFVKK